MNEETRTLIRFVCDGDLRRSQTQAQIILRNSKTQKDAAFVTSMLKSLEDSKNRFIQLPTNLQGILSVEDSAFFPASRFLLRNAEEKVVAKILGIREAASRLKKLNIAYTPTLMLYGQSGTGKTMLAKYIAYRAGMPYLYVRFSGLMNSYLGKTQENLARIFDYAKKEPCVLCIDEIDAIAMRRGPKSDVGEMNRIVISLMQEMEQLPNDLVVIGTTNRFEELDEALVRRFTVSKEVLPLSRVEACAMLRKFFAFAEMPLEKEEAERWLSAHFPCQNSDVDAHSYNQSAIIKAATLCLVDILMNEKEVTEMP